mmetsp:Transcript_9353/g.27302  ORF Transcript_9353/g.27302 Transcript_9353/m.27302 type:complete len:87 (+) Transcript_9353:232-492(+)
MQCAMMIPAQHRVSSKVKVLSIESRQEIDRQANTKQVSPQPQARTIARAPFPGLRTMAGAALSAHVRRALGEPASAQSRVDFDSLL